MRLKGDGRDGRGGGNLEGEVGKEKGTGDSVESISSPGCYHSSSSPDSFSPPFSVVGLDPSVFCISSPDSPLLNLEGRRRINSVSSARSPVVGPPTKKSGSGLSVGLSLGIAPLPSSTSTSPPLSLPLPQASPPALSPNSSSYHSSPSIISPINRGKTSTNIFDKSRKEAGLYGSLPSPSISPPPTSSPPPLPSFLQGSGPSQDRARMATSPGGRRRIAYKSLVIRGRGGGEADPKERERERVVTLFKRKLYLNIPEMRQEERTKTEEVQLSYIRNIAPLIKGGFMKAKVCV